MRVLREFGSSPGFPAPGNRRRESERSYSVCPDRVRVVASASDGDEFPDRLARVLFPCRCVGRHLRNPVRLQDSNRRDVRLRRFLRQSLLAGGVSIDHPPIRIGGDARDRGSGRTGRPIRTKPPHPEFLRDSKPLPGSMNPKTQPFPLAGERPPPLRGMLWNRQLKKSHFLVKLASEGERNRKTRPARRWRWAGNPFVPPARRKTPGWKKKKLPREGGSFGVVVSRKGERPRGWLSQTSFEGFELLGKARRQLVAQLGEVLLEIGDGFLVKIPVYLHQLVPIFFGNVEPFEVEVFFLRH